MRPHTAEIDRIVVHHSASPLDTTIRQIKDWHVDERHFGAIGYHYVITQLGIVEYTRPLHLQGAHAQGFNNGSIGICLIGDNTVPRHRWRTEQYFALQRLYMALRKVFRYLDVFGHRDLSSSTECPGLDVQPLLLGPRYFHEDDDDFGGVMT